MSSMHALSMSTVSRLLSSMEKAVVFLTSLASQHQMLHLRISPFLKQQSSRVIKILSSSTTSVDGSMPTMECVLESSQLMLTLRRSMSTMSPKERKTSNLTTTSSGASQQQEIATKLPLADGRSLTLQRMSITLTTTLLRSLQTLLELDLHPYFKITSRPSMRDRESMMASLEIQLLKLSPNSAQISYSTWLAPSSLKSIARDIRRSNSIDSSHLSSTTDFSEINRHSESSASVIQTLSRDL